MAEPETILVAAAGENRNRHLIDLIVFDLDGTLIDSSRDLAVSTNAMRAQFGLPPLAQDVVNSYVGNGAGVLVRRAIGLDAPEERVAEALDYFLKYYRAHALEHTRLYPGVREMLEAIAADDRKLAVLTNKPEKISVDILDALGVLKLFLGVCGGNTLAQKKPHPAGLLDLVARAGLEPQAALMVGDSSVDVQTARNAGARCCGVLWGFQPETFAAAPPDFTIAAPGDLLPHLTAKN